MPGSLRIRRAGAADAAAIADILRRAFAEFEPLYTPQGFAATTPDEFQVRRRLDEGPAWLALREDAIAGTAAAVLQGEKGLYVRGVAVLPSARGCGIAEALMNEVENFARDQGCSRMFLTTTPFLESAIRLYERIGFRRIPDGSADLFGTPLLKMAKDWNPHIQ
jgi:putative acetyltransferase